MAGASDREARSGDAGAGTASAGGGSAGGSVPAGIAAVGEAVQCPQRKGRPLSLQSVTEKSFSVRADGCFVSGGVSSKLKNKHEAG